MPILNYTTEINAEKTVTQIQRILAAKSARRIMIEYGPTQEIARITFEIAFNGALLSFVLPANIEGVFKSLEKSNISKSFKTKEQAERVCWRILKDWLESQMALVESFQADFATVMLPYAIMKDGKTVAENLLQNKGSGQLLITQQ